ncbi:3D-(3,5/4)-trihydroxycyclohexane-1,2-dione hydrolase [Streptomyces sp. DvalAA-14]|uniref:3D-(3,5/4)-trihydroxycyclohexane-1,2-dione acylhydrolase (decyclizing) n=1 Tax=unclassified Streptomyces TaxID=2593676 RepID=UPI00081BA035|nr:MULTISPECIES: 3D-(3,5/4)-trihydroxycyclohexane-1,2-dione acylhydrolase (decyclizing) [unclassified Streptomyces]MYS22427.1 3D-(3,5/4)-trihydroxycyclohexane-1,2-dione acylhydrolase (decyclizing) [Streptomyces sp. SID4948]SCE16043.1 3D-(3,5/4)-trihydroxycyclohexane-1,2-dione hydrolase [Streptomyces sp. DvalAA-14]
MSTQRTATVRLTVAQATTRFLAAQWSQRDGERRRFFAGVFGIFGHGNVAGLGQALLQMEQDAAGPRLPYVLARNEQAMVHTSVAYARQQDRLEAWACTASVGPGSTNMLTGAALATINRIPVLLLPSDTFATRVSAPVLQELEQPYAADISVNDAFRPLSRFFDRISRPEQLPSALLGAMRVLTDPVDTGAVTIALPQDVQAEAHDWPVELFAPRTWHIARPPAETARVADAADAVRAARRPMIVAGGGIHYSGAEPALRAFAEATGIPVGETQAGKGSLPHAHPRLMGAIGSTGTTAANALARDADLVIGVGTRWTDFTTASRTAFQHPGVRFVNINIAAFDAGKHAGLSVVADAREALTALTAAVAGHRVPAAHEERQAGLWAAWDAAVEAAYHPDASVTGRLAEGVLTQATVLGCVNEHTDPRDVVLCAAGSMPGDLHKLWRVRDRKAYHVEYGYSCMGYEIPAAIGVRLADPTRDAFAMVGDGGYLMMPTELATAVQERVKLVVVLVQNNGFHSIGSLSESLGSQRFGTQYRYRSADGRLDGPPLPTDLAANARSLGAHVIEVRSRAGLVAAIAEAKAWPADGGPVVIHVETDPLVSAPDSESWWDVPVSAASTLDSTRVAHETYARHKETQRPLLSPTPVPAPTPPPAPDEAAPTPEEGAGRE